MSKEETANGAWQALERAIKVFNASPDCEQLLFPAKDSGGDGPAASERSIAHRLAYFLELELCNWNPAETKSEISIDCEYNRHRGAKKAVLVEERLKGIVETARKRELKNPDADGFYVFSVAPDIIVHQRGNDDLNLLIVELKKTTNKEIPEYDDLKLSLFTKPDERDEGYGYHFGAAVLAEDDVPKNKRRLRIRCRFSRGEEDKTFVPHL